MNKKQLSDILSEVLIPIGFNKRADNWLYIGQSIDKIVDLQKAKFGGSFYINYGYILKSIPLDGHLMHVFKGLGSKDLNEANRIKELLNLEENISLEERSKELKEFLVTKLVADINKVNNEHDLHKELMNRPHLNDILVSVKDYFNLK